MALLTLRQRTFAALTFAARTLHGLVDVAVAAAVGGGGGKKHKRKRVLKKTIYGTVVSVWQEEHHERPPIAIAEEITERVAETYRDIEAEIAEVEMRTLIIRLMTQVIEEEDEETALLSMM